MVDLRPRPADTLYWSTDKGASDPYRKLTCVICGMPQDLYILTNSAWVFCRWADQGSALSIRRNSCQWITSESVFILKSLRGCIQLCFLHLSSGVSLMDSFWFEFTYPLFSPTPTPSLFFVLSLHRSGHLQDGVVCDEDARGRVNAGEEDG